MAPGRALAGRHRACARPRLHDHRGGTLRPHDDLRRPGGGGPQRPRLSWALPTKPRPARPRHPFARLQRREGAIRSRPRGDRRRRRSTGRLCARLGDRPGRLAAERPPRRPAAAVDAFRLCRDVRRRPEKALRLPALYRALAEAHRIGFVDAGEFIRCSPLDGITMRRTSTPCSARFSPRRRG